MYISSYNQNLKEGGFRSGADNNATKNIPSDSYFIGEIHWKS